MARKTFGDSKYLISRGSLNQEGKNPYLIDKSFYFWKEFFSTRHNQQMNIQLIRSECPGGGVAEGRRHSRAIY